MAVPKWLESVSQVASAVAPITGAAAPIIGALGSLFGAKQNAKNVEQANATNFQIARENNSAQERMLMMNNAFNRQQAIDMFNMENAYNSPENQVKLLLQAGLNPATMYQNGGQVARSDASTPQASSSGITPTMPNIQPVPSPVGAMFGNFETLSRVAANMASAGLSGVQKDKITFLMGEELRGIIADNALKETEGQLKVLQLRFEKEFGRINRQTELGLKVSEIWQNFQNAFRSAAEGELAEAEKAYKDSITELNKLEYHIKDASKQSIIDLAKQTFDNAVKEGKRIDSATKLNQAAASNEFAQARLTNEQASQLEDMHFDIVHIKKNEGTMSTLEKNFQLRTFSSRVKSFVEGNKNSLNLQEAEYSKFLKDIDYVQELIQRADKENKTYFYRLASDELDKIMNRLTQNAGVAAKFIP